MARECLCCALVVSIFFPPLSVLMLEGCGVDFCINLLLTLLGWIPGIIHACCIMARPESTQHQHLITTTNYLPQTQQPSYYPQVHVINVQPSEPPPQPPPPGLHLPPPPPYQQQPDYNNVPQKYP